MCDVAAKAVGLTFLGDHQIDFQPALLFVQVSDAQKSVLVLVPSLAMKDYTEPNLQSSLGEACPPERIVKMASSSDIPFAQPTQCFC